MVMGRLRRLRGGLKSWRFSKAKVRKAKDRFRSESSFKFDKEAFSKAGVSYDDVLRAKKRLKAVGEAAPLLVLTSAVTGLAVGVHQGSRRRGRRRRR